MDRGKGKIRVYHINEREIIYDEERDIYYNPDDPSYRERWSADIFHYQSLPKGLKLQAEVEYRDDEAIEHDVEPGDYPLIRELTSYLSLSYPSKMHLIRMSHKRRDVWEEGRFRPQLIEAPRVKYFLKPVSFGPIYFRIEGSLLNEYTIEAEEYRLREEFDVGFLTRIRMGYLFTISPCLGFLEDERYYTRVGFEAGPREILRLGLLHEVRRELEGGLDSENIKGSLVLYLKRILRLRTTATYDILNKRYEPLFIDGESSLLGGFTSRFDARYNPDSKRFTSLDLEITRRGKRVDLGFGVWFLRLKEREDFLDLKGRVGIWASPKTRIELGSSLDTRDNRIRRWEASIFRDLHCWEVELGARGHPSFTPMEGREVEAYLHLNLKEF
jgi:hypothetical protein